MISISESRLDSTVLDPVIYIENYEILLFDRNRDEGGVACYIRSHISYKLNSFLPNANISTKYNIQYFDATH